MARMPATLLPGIHNPGAEAVPVTLISGGVAERPNALALKARDG